MKKIRNGKSILKMDVNEILLKMKLLTILIFIACVSASASSYSQATKFNLDMRDVSLGEVFQKIEEQSEYVILYNENTLDIGRKVNVIVKDKTVEDILDQIFKGDKDAYKVFDKQIAIYPNEIKELPTQSKTEIKTEQKKEISGTVKDNKGIALPGVTVMAKGTTIGIITDAKGQYKLTVPSGVTTLIFSFVGMKSQEKVINNQSILNIILEEESLNLEEAVVVGYGRIKKIDLTSSVGQVKLADLSQAPVVSFTEALAGRVAGVQVSSQDGQPGSNVNIQVRGPGSLTQSTSPLFVVDGFPVEDLDPNTLNMEDIESMNILKDASSAAIYGSRAANGVILIETKRGNAGNAKVTFNSSTGFSMKMKSIELMNPYEYVKYQNELFPGQAGAAEYIANTPLDYYKGVKGIDLQDYMFTNGSYKKNDFAIRGGNEKTKYSISGSIVNQQGVVINTGLDKYTARTALDQKISEKIKIGFTASYSGVKQNGPTVSVSPSSSLSSYIMYRVWGYRPVTPPYIPIETLLDPGVDEQALNGSDFRVNPVPDLENQHEISNSKLIEGNGYVSYDILKNLVLKITAGVRNTSINNEAFYNSKTWKGSPGNPANTDGINAKKSNVINQQWSNSGTLSYNGKFNKGHELSGLLLFEASKIYNEGFGYSSRMIPNENLGIAGMDEGLTFNPVSNSSTSSMASYGTRWNYNYKSKYLISGSFRADGSSKFLVPNKWGYFPAGSIGWNMQQEKFIKNMFPFISNSKLRASYGIVGNNRVTDFAAFSRLLQTTNGYSFKDQTPISAANVVSIINKSLRWEKTTSIDLGYEFGIFNNKVELIVDLYKKETKDLLLNAPLPTSTGFSTAYKNVGRLGNKGIEITFNTVNLAKKSVSWTSSFNISFNRNTVLELASKDQVNLQSLATGLESQYNTPLYIAEIGKESGMMFGFVWDGNYQYSDFDTPTTGTYVLKKSVPSNGSAALRSTIKPGDIKYKDLNGDGIIDVNDKTIIGRGQPIHTGGFTNNFNYKGFGLNVFFQWSYGNNIYNANRLTFEGNGNLRRNLNQYASYINRWSPENQTNENYRAGGQGPYGMHSSRVVEDGSYLRLKTISLNYSLNSQFIKRFSLSKLTFSVAAQNTLTWTNYSGLDPEVSERTGVLTPGLDYSAYPQSRTIVFGVNAEF